MPSPYRWGERWRCGPGDSGYDNWRAAAPAPVAIASRVCLVAQPLTVQRSGMSRFRSLASTSVQATDAAVVFGSGKPSLIACRPLSLPSDREIAARDTRTGADRLDHWAGLAPWPDAGAPPFFTSRFSFLHSARVFSSPALQSALAARPSSRFC